MVSRGHNLRDLMDYYPISTLRGLMSASQYNRRNDLILQTQSHSVAILNGLDAGFNKGKQKFLKKYIDKLLQGMIKQRAKGSGKSEDAQSKLLAAFGLKAPTHGTK